MKKKILTFNIFSVVLICSSFAVSCSTFNQSKWTDSTYGAKKMEETENLAKYLLMTRGWKFKFRINFHC
jgi:hypothetical protein